MPAAPRRPRTRAHRAPLRLLATWRSLAQPSTQCAACLSSCDRIRRLTAKLHRRCIGVARGERSFLREYESFKYCLLRFRRFCNSSSDSSDAAPSWAWPLAAHEEKEHVDACRRCSALWARRDFLRAPTAHNVARCRPCEHRDHLQCPRRPDRSSPCSWPSQPWKPCPTRSDQRVPSQFRVVVVPTACAVDGVGGSLLDGSTRNSETDRTAEERKREKRVRRVSRYRSAGLRKSDSLSQILTHPRLDPDTVGGARVNFTGRPPVATTYLM